MLECVTLTTRASQLNDPAEGKVISHEKTVEVPEGCRTDKETLQHLHFPKRHAVLSLFLINKIQCVSIMMFMF